MHKILVQYKDLDGISRSENVYFNMSPSVVLDNLDIADELQAVVDKMNQIGETDEPPKELQREILESVKKMMRLAYGERDGDRFVQGDEVWIPFTQTPKYDALLIGFFTDPLKNFLPFCQNIISPELLAQLPDRDESDEDANPLGTFEGLPEGQVEEATEEKPSEYDFTRQELLDMPQEEFDKLVGTDPRKMSRLALMVATQRRVRDN